MSDAAEQKVANNFKTLITSYSDAFANQVLAADFSDYSDSVAELINGGCTTGGMATVCNIITFIQSYRLTDMRNLAWPTGLQLPRGV